MTRRRTTSDCSQGPPFSNGDTWMLATCRLVEICGGIVETIGERICLSVMSGVDTMWQAVKCVERAGRHRHV